MNKRQARTMDEPRAAWRRRGGDADTVQVEVEVESIDWNQSVNWAELAQCNQRSPKAMPAERETEGELERGDERKMAAFNGCKMLR